MTREAQIKHEVGNYFVLENTGRNASYTVFKNTGTHSISDSAYAHTPDGLSLAIARAEYKAKRDAKP